jgi:hypothetical protein
MKLSVKAQKSLAPNVFNVVCTILLLGLAVAFLLFLEHLGLDPMRQ